MKQVFQHMGTGETSLVDVPAPALLPGSLLIRTRRTLISAGTERSLIDFGRASIVQKAMQQPERVRMALEKKTAAIAPQGVSIIFARKSDQVCRSTQY